MRLRKLSLDRFGHFTDHHLDFGEVADKPDFHIIYGANEAGKTTIMEAALRLFYGFQAREPYDFKHQRKNLRVSAQLEIAGQVHYFTRLPTRTGALCNEVGTALPETALATHLAGLSLDDYRQLLCLDDETIERGGEEIAQAKGDIGRLLFSAAAGIADLSKVLTEVREAADQIWRKRASKTRVAELKRKHTEIVSTIREQDVSAGKWNELKKQFADAQFTEHKTRETCGSLRETESLIEARRRALPKITEIDDLVSRTEIYANYPDLLDFDLEDLVKLQTDDARITADLERLASEIDDKKTKLSSIVRLPEIAGLSDKLVEFDDLRARDVTAGHDIERRRKEMQTELTAMENSVRDLGVTDHANVQSLALSPADIQQLETARDALRNAEKTLATETREVDDLTDRCEKAKRDADKTAAKVPAEAGLRDILKRYDVDHLANAFTKAQQMLKAAEQNAKRALDSLSVGSVRFDTVPTRVSSGTRAQDWLDKHSEISQKITESESALSNLWEDVSAQQAEIKHRTADRKVIPDTEAGTLRDRRDKLWQVHRDALSNQTALTFESAMGELDTAMDGRVLQASDLGQLRQSEKLLVVAQARADQNSANLKNLRTERTTIESEVDNAASAVGLPVPQLPAEWLEWIQRHEAAVETARELTELKHSHQSVVEQAQRLHKELCEYLDVETLNFESAVIRAREHARSETKSIEAIKAADDKLSEINDDLLRRQKKKQAAVEMDQRAREDWQELLAGIFGNIAVQESLLASLDPLRALREHNEKRLRAAQRVDAMADDQVKFHQEMLLLCKSHGLTMENSARDTYEMLRKQSDVAQSTETEFEKLTRDIEKTKKEQENKKRELESVSHKSRAFGSIFPAGVAVDTLIELRAVATQAKTVITDRKKLTELELVVKSELQANDTNHARKMLEDTTEAKLYAEAERVKTDITAADQQLTQATEARTLAGTALAAVTGDTELTVLTERKNTIELELEEATREYLELTLGHKLADQAIHRYRDTHRGGMMGATEECFSTLTHGAYPRLITELDGSSESLLAIDPGGTSKRAEAMSKGTRFQLYLALRAAAYEQMVNQGTSLPFFCDDIFETFDEARTSAACQVMEKIGHRGQAIYLTHHRHVVDIARKVCTVSPKIHEI